MRGRWLAPLGEALCDNPDLQLVIPMRARRAPPQPPPSNALCALLLDMLDSDPDARPNADQLKKRVHSAILLHWPQSSILTDITMRPIKLMEQWWYLTLFILSKLKICLFNVLHFVRYICYYMNCTTLSLKPSVCSVSWCFKLFYTYLLQGQLKNNWSINNSIVWRTCFQSPNLHFQNLYQSAILSQILK